MSPMFTLSELTPQEKVFCEINDVQAASHDNQAMGKISYPKAAPRTGKRFFIAEHALQHDIRQKDIVKATGLTKGYVSGLWSGAKEPSPTVQQKIADFIGVPARALQEPPKSLNARAIAAINRIPQSERETAVKMLEGLANGANKSNG